MEEADAWVPLSLRQPEQELPALTSPVIEVDEVAREEGQALLQGLLPRHQGHSGSSLEEGLGVCWEVQGTQLQVPPWLSDHKGVGCPRPGFCSSDQMVGPLAGEEGPAAERLVRGKV